MPVESAAGIWDLVRTNPLGTDDVSEGDDHHRLIKGSLLDTFPNVTEPVTSTAKQLNSYVPVGGIIAMGSNATFPGQEYLWCNGAAVSRTTFSDLYSEIGDLWGAGDGTTTFNVPDLENCTLAGSTSGAPVGSVEDLAPADPQPNIKVARVAWFIKT